MTGNAVLMITRRLKRKWLLPGQNEAKKIPVFKSLFL
jgi:hypothetical protein